MKRKFLAGLLSLAMVLSITPMTAFAEGEVAVDNISQLEMQNNDQEETDASEATDASQDQNADASENEENQQTTEESQAQENQTADSQEEETNSADSESETADQVAAYSVETQAEGIPANAVHITSSNAQKIGAGTYYYDATSAKTAKQVQINGGTKEDPTIIYMSGEINLTLNV